MELHLAAHPDWPFPMSNAPATPPEPGPGHAALILPATERHNRGKAHFSHALNYWLAKSGLTTRQLSRIADWGLDEKGWLHDAKITHLRRNSFLRPLPIRYVDACGAANQAIWLWQCRGEQEAISKLGPPAKDRVQPAWLASAVWLPHPDYPSEPLGPADWFDVVAGYLELPYVASPKLAPQEGPQLTRELCALLFSLADDGSQREQLQQILRAYPVSDRERRERLGSVLLGISAYTADEVEAELYALSEIVRNLRRLNAKDYGPAELYAELSRDRRQSGGAADDD